VSRDRSRHGRLALIEASRPPIFAGMAAFHALFNIVRVCALAGAPEGGNLYDDGILLRRTSSNSSCSCSFCRLNTSSRSLCICRTGTGELSEIDSLTRVFNRRVFSELLERERARGPLCAALRRHRPLQGHQRHLRPRGGRLCPRAVCAAASRNASLPRYHRRLGGDEFAVIMPDADASDARSAAERRNGMSKRRDSTSRDSDQGHHQHRIAGTDIRGSPSNKSTAKPTRPSTRRSAPAATGS
jgi:GGDEF domain-containing protein